MTEAFRLAAGAVARASEAITGLAVDEKRMLANLGPGEVGDLESCVPQLLVIDPRYDSRNPS